MDYLKKNGRKVKKGMKLYNMLLSFGCLFSLLVLLSSCEDSLIIVNDSPQDNHINICVLGNSYSNDAFSYVPFILKEYGYTCKIEIYYRGSLSLHDLDEQWYDESQYGLADLDGEQHIRLHFSIDTRTDQCWRKESVASAEDILSLDKWDIVSLQQVSSHAQYQETYEPYLKNVIERINAQCKYPFSLGWFVSYNRAADNANQESLDTQKEICRQYPFNIVIPVAAAVFSCQEHEELAELGDSKYKKMYASDNVHMQEGLPCYVAALTVAETIMQSYFHRDSVIGNSIRPTDKWINSINGITPNGSSTGVTEANCALAQRAAVNAYYHKFEIIPLE